MVIWLPPPPLPPQLSTWFMDVPDVPIEDLKDIRDLKSNCDHKTKGVKDKKGKRNE